MSIELLSAIVLTCSYNMNDPHICLLANLVKVSDQSLDKMIGVYL